MRTTRTGRILGIAVLAASLGMAGAASAQAAPFQARKVLTCNGAPTNCRANFAEVAAGKRLHLDFVSCFVDTASAVEPNKAAFLGVNDALGAAFRHTLLWEIRVTASRRITIVSQPVDITVGAGKRPDISIPFPGTITATGDCSISGTLITLP